MASTSNAENLVEIARILYQLCDYTDFRADFSELEFGWFSQIRSHFFLSTSDKEVDTTSIDLLLLLMVDNRLFTKSDDQAFFSPFECLGTRLMSNHSLFGSSEQRIM